jgi:hypothetical protein
MTKYILGVEYRQLPMTIACIQVAGQTQQLALRRAKQLGSALTKRLPEDAYLSIPREGERAGELFTYEVRVTIETCLDEAKAIISELVLRGSV